MVKLRNAYYCNLKLLLLFLVIYGHAIEPGLGTDPSLYSTYRLIYLFHIPLFAFLSGLFVKDSAGCLRQLRRIGPVYLVCQSAAAALGWTTWHTPWWILWYLLSLCFWLGASALLLKLRRGKWGLLLLSLAAGCLIGTVPWAGRSWSLSRSIVFFPYFWLGVLWKPDFPWHRLRIPGLLALGAVVLCRPRMAVSVLWHAGPCPPLLRLVCYGLSTALGLFVLSWCPRRRFPWTRAGADTMPAYLLHGPLVRLMQPVGYPVLFTTVFLYIIQKAQRWHGAYGIIGKEEGPWPDLKTCTKPKESRSTGSSWP